MAASSTPDEPQNMSVDIPLKKTKEGEEDTWLTMRISELPGVSDAVMILKDEEARVGIWHRVGLLYYRAGHVMDFIKIADEGYRVAAKNSGTRSSSVKIGSVISLLLSLGAAYVRISASSDIDPSDVDVYIRKAIGVYNVVSKLDIAKDHHEAEFYAGQASLKLLQQDGPGADQLFSLITNELKQKNFIPAILGKGMIAFSNKNYPVALQHFKQVLRMAPNCPANVRVGIGHCLWKLNFKEKAKLAFERAVELFPNDPDALCALATCYLSTISKESTFTAVKLLMKSWSVSKSHLMTLVLLADHFYHKKEYDRALEFAHKAFENSYAKVDVMKRSGFIIARCHQAKNDFLGALHFYYEALKEPVEGFHLPYYGLVYCYMRERNDVPNSCDALHKLLSVDPKNIFAKKMLGYLLCNSVNQSQRLEAQLYLKPVLEQDSKDIVARIALATSEEALDDGQSATNYALALKVAEKRIDYIVMPEIYNNFGCTLFRLKKYDEAQKNFKKALEVTSEIQEAIGTRFVVHNIAIIFNLARTLEARFQCEAAEEIYKDIVRKHPSYYYCFIRLGVMAREKGRLYDADHHFKQALQCSLLHPDAWSLMGNLHLIQSELDPACKKFGKIFEIDEEMQKDPYNSISLANLELIKLQQSIYGDDSANSRFSKEHDANHMRKALEWYKQVITRDPSNIWATNGTGCVLACKGLLSEAREIFQQVLEAKQDDVKDILMNIGHTYLEDEKYHSAIQIYERCNKLSSNTDCDVLQCIAKAHFLNKAYDLAKMALVKARRIAPYSNQILFQLGKCLRKAGWQSYHVKSEINNFGVSVSETGIKQIEMAQKIFLGIQKISFNKKLKFAATIESGHCEVLISKTPRMLQHLKNVFEEKEELKSKVSQEVMALKMSQMEEKVLQNKERLLEEENRKRKRDEIKIKTEKVKQSLLDNENENKKEKKSKKDQEDFGQIFADATDDDFVPEDEVKLRKDKKKRKPKRKKVEGKTKRQQPEGEDTDNPPVPRQRRKRIKSRRIIDDDEGSGDDNQEESFLPVENIEVDESTPPSESSPGSNVTEVREPRKINAASGDNQDDAGILESDRPVKNIEDNDSLPPATTTFDVISAAAALTKDDISGQLKSEKDNALFVRPAVTQVNASSLNEKKDDLLNLESLSRDPKSVNDKVLEKKEEVTDDPYFGMPHLITFGNIMPTYSELDSDPSPPVLHRYFSDDEN